MMMTMIMMRMMIRGRSNRIQGKDLNVRSRTRQCFYRRGH